MKTPATTFSYFVYKNDPDTGHIFNRKATIGEFESALINFLKQCPPAPMVGPTMNAFTDFDYLHITMDYSTTPITENKSETQIPDSWEIQASLHRGSSEGYYFHIDAVEPCKIPKTIILGKCFGNDDVALYLMNLINNFLLQIN